VTAEEGMVVVVVEREREKREVRVRVLGMTREKIWFAIVASEENDEIGNEFRV
jgi:hypothetical protein